MRWQLLDDDAARLGWNSALAEREGCNPMQSFEWGELRSRASHARCLRWMARFGVAVVVADGGPVGDLETALPGMLAAVQQRLGVRHCYCRISPRRAYNARDVLALRAAGWKRAQQSSGSGLTAWLDLTPLEADLMRALSRSWRRNIKRAQGNGLRVDRWQQPSPQALHAAYTEMASIKGIKSDFTENEIGAIVEVFGDSIITVRCIDQNGDLQCIRSSVVVGDTALDIFAATTAAGRQNNASYLVFWHLLRECRARGVSCYDLNHIDPIGVPGVTRFKLGTGARVVEYLGDWDCADSERMRLAMSLLRMARDAWRHRGQA